MSTLTTAGLKKRFGPVLTKQTARGSTPVRQPSRLKTNTRLRRKSRRITTGSAKRTASILTNQEPLRQTLG